MEVLNVVGVILGIVSSAISIYVFFIDRPRRQGQRVEHSAPEASKAKPQRQPGASPPSAGAEPSGTSAIGSLLSKVGAVIWGLLGLGCLAEGMTYGEPLLLLLGGAFIWLAYKMWK